MWQESSLPAPFDSAGLAREIAEQAAHFDRKIFWRNFREYAASGIFAAMMLFNLPYPERRILAITGIAAVAFVSFYLWRSHRRKLDPDPGADARSYQAALLARFDRQIRLLQRVKYWYVLPLYAWILLAIVSSRPSAARIPTLIGATALAGFIVWLNERYAVRKLLEQRERAEALLGD